MTEPLLSKLARRILWFDVSIKSKYLFIITQVLIGLIASLLSTSIIPDKYKPYASFLMFFLLAVVIVVSILVLTVVKSHGLNYLICNTSEGLLFDKKHEIINVALRRETLFMILSRHCSCDQEKMNKCLYKVGKNVGNSFIMELHEKLNMKGSMPKTAIEQLHHAFEYDSSSGLGKMILSYPAAQSRSVDIDDTVVVEVENPFTLTSQGDSNHFLAGYLAGIISKITNSQFELADIKSLAKQTRSFRFIKEK